MGKRIVVDYVHSTVSFEVKHMMVSTVRGQFDSFTANLEADDYKDLTNAKIQFQFQANSINTRHQERDQHLRSADFFDVQKFPTIDFYSTHINKVEGHYEITGNLTIKGITRPVTFQAAFGGKATSPEGIKVYGYAAETTINREDFGLTWNAVLETGGFLVGKEVKIKVDLEINEYVDGIQQPLVLEKGSSKDDLAIETKSKDIHRVIAENVTDLVAVIDQDGAIQYTSPSFNNVLQEDHSNNIYRLIHEDDRDIVKDEIRTYYNKTIKNDLKSEFRLKHKDGQYIEVDANIVSIKSSPLLLLVMRDISERKEVEKTIYQLALHDPLTNLPNRRLFMNQLRSELMDRKLSKTRRSVLFIDLDNFKTINDQWGHDTGDLVLKEAATRLRAAIRPSDIVARIGGDEFVVLLKDVEDEVTVIIQRILEQFQHPIKDSGQEYKLTCSIGIANYPEHGQSPEELIRNADTALYYVKENGKNHFKIFDQLMEHQSLERRLLENELRQAIKDQQFYLEYQPKVDMSTDELIGMEALVRWKHPDLGVISPGKFIPLAEETGLIVPLGEWVLRESCKQTVEWQDMGYPPLILSVNISVRQLEDVNFITKVKEILQETGLDPQWLELEITESVLVNAESMISTLKELHKLGIYISIDDFGTGYSSLSYLKELPIDTLKIDRSFVKDIHQDKESREIAKAIINLANSIGLHVIAEGVELEEHVKELNKEGAIFGQGYYFSKPLKAGAFEEYLTTNHEAS